MKRTRTLVAGVAATIALGSMAPASADDPVYPGDIPTETTIDKPRKVDLPDPGQRMRFAFETDARAGDVDLRGRYRIRLFRRTLDDRAGNAILLDQKWRRARDGVVSVTFPGRKAGPYRLQVRYVPPDGSVFGSSGSKIRFTIS